MSQYFSINLKLACSHYRSISEVCRLVGLNRAQFNKYLSGQSQPTPYNLRRIGDFFGVEDYELNLPPEQFSALIGARATPSPAALPDDPLLALLAPLRSQSASLSRYCGYYYEYANCLSVPGNTLVSLVHLREEQGNFLFERQERQERSITSNPQADDGVRCRYLGAAFALQDRLFLLDYESLTLNEMSQTILIPSFKSRITRLNGLKTGVSSGDRRTPACTRVVWEFLGAEINRTNAYRQVRLYAVDDPGIDAQIRHQLQAGPMAHGLYEVQ
jgi:transcriptional regulator with XRE-family HTH domain